MVLRHLGPLREASGGAERVACLTGVDGAPALPDVSAAEGVGIDGDVEAVEVWTGAGEGGMQESGEKDVEEVCAWAHLEARSGAKKPFANVL